MTSSASCPDRRRDRGGDLIRLHGDCHGGNILWRDDTPHFVDLDDCLQRAGDPGPVDVPVRRAPRAGAAAGGADRGLRGVLRVRARQLRWIETLRTLRIMRYAAWLARRWDDPAFPRRSPGSPAARYWSDHILELREQFARLQEPPLRLL
jgi:Ser/Thr protein kinase RdoA (MazF antagonist)